MGLVLVKDAARRSTRTVLALPPWTVNETEACFIAKDHGGKRSPRRSSRTVSQRPLTSGEAGRMAADFAKPPEMLRRLHTSASIHASVCAPQRSAPGSFWTR